MFNNLSELLFSQVAVGIYAIILLVMFVFMIIALMKYARKSNEAITRINSYADNAVKEANSEETSTDKAEKTEVQEEKQDKNTEPRFFMLNELDKESESYEPPKYEDKITLSELCERFRCYSAKKHGLYYSIEDVRRFISNLASSHLLVMQGMSGTGKTSLAYAFGEFINNSSAIVPIQPMWKERSDLLGYYNEFTQRFSETVLLQKMYEANYKNDIFIVVLDEMNIARIEYYFAEFLSLLEIPSFERRLIDVVSDVWENDPKLLRDGKLLLPKNMWFIGTANNDDSTFAISDKVYDRAMIMNLDVKAEAFDAKEVSPIYMTAEYFDSLVDKARRSFRITRRNKRRLHMLDQYMIEKFKITFGNRINKQMETYIPVFIACGGDELSALDDIIAKKVFRKLDTQNPIYVRNNAEALSSFLDELFGYDRMPLCKAYLSRFERNA